MQHFEPDQRVLVRYIGNKVWRLKRYSFFDGQEHETQDGATFSDKDILPYAGNEHLLGTMESPTPKWEPNPGELVAVRKEGFAHWVVAQFKRKSEYGFVVTNRSDGFLDRNIFDYCEPLRAHFTIPEE